MVDCHIFSGGLRLYADFPDNLSPHFGLCGLQSNGNDIDIKSFFLAFCAKLHSRNHQHITIILIYCDIRPAEPGNSHYGNFCRGPPNKKMIKAFQKKSYVHFIFHSLFRKLACVKNFNFFNDGDCLKTKTNVQMLAFWLSSLH